MATLSLAITRAAVAMTTAPVWPRCPRGQFGWLPSAYKRRVDAAIDAARAGSGLAPAGLRSVLTVVRWCVAVGVAHPHPAHAAAEATERGPMPPHAVASVLRPVLGGLAAAHRAGLVHRDVMPENVLISDDGEVKIADFGLVRAVAAAGITSASVILGTAAYLSPEQVRDGNAGPRSDVYSLGILTYELFTGRTPFTGDSQLTIAYQRLDADVPRPSTVIEGVPAQFDDFVACATARDPGDRYADAIEMAADLDAIAEDLELPDFQVPAPRNSAQHRSAAVHHSRMSEPRPPAPRSPQQPPTQQPPVQAPVHHRTRQLTRSPADWPGRRPDDAESEPGDQYEYEPVAGQFAGISISEFVLAGQHARRMVLIWVAIVLAITGMVATAAWTIGSNLTGLL